MTDLSDIRSELQAQTQQLKYIAAALETIAEVLWTAQEKHVRDYNPEWESYKQLRREAT